MGFYRHADIEQAAFAAEAARAAALRKAGICTHGVECLECGEQWDAFDAYYAARTEMLG